MDAKKVRKYLAEGYGTFLALIVGVLACCLIFMGQDKTMELLRTNPMMVVDVVVLVTILGSFSVQIIMAEEYHVFSVFRVERQKYYSKRMRVAGICRISSAAIAIGFKIFVMYGTGQMEQIGIGGSIVFYLIIGAFYWGVIELAMLLIELLPVVKMIVIVGAVPGLLIFMSIQGVQVPSAKPVDVLELGGMATACCLAAIYTRKIHKIHYQMKDC